MWPNVPNNAGKLLVLLGSLLPLCACDPCNATFEKVEKAERYEAAEKTAPPTEVESLEVMTWNIKHAGGRIRFFYECPGDRVEMTEKEVEQNLEGIAAKISQVDPDIVLLQEVDIDSNRTAGVDQLQRLLDQTPLNYGVYASQWRSSYIPRHGLGRVDSGNAILSRWPIKEATRLALPLISSQNFVVRYFYLKRNILKARLAIPGFGSLFVLNTHFSAFDQDGTRRKQLEEFEAELKALDDQGQRFVAGGDLNLIPPGSKVTENFADIQCEKEDFEAADYSDKTGALKDLYTAWEPAIPLETYRADNDPYLTYTGDEDVFWTRKLDYLFTNGEFADGSGLVHQNKERGGMATIELSDHAPVTAVLKK
ncbi:MAG: endonuclease/exonuclease/phosphatase family protein [Bradymonadaceae bacterium]